jgi:hypothetical protein
LLCFIASAPDLKVQSILYSICDSGVLFWLFKASSSQAFLKTFSGCSKLDFEGWCPFNLENKISAA